MYKKIFLTTLLLVSLSSLAANCPDATTAKDGITSQGWAIHGQWPTSASGNQFLYALASLQTGQKGEKVLLSCFYSNPAGTVYLSKFDATLLPRGAQWKCTTQYNFGTCTCTSNLVSNCPF